MSSSSNLSQSASAPPVPRITDRSFTSDEPLPPNYSRHLDSDGRPYYLNSDDNSTSWYHPKASPPAQDPNFPAHVERKIDVRGRSFYVDHEKKENSWLNPLKIDEVRGRPGSHSELEYTEDGERFYYVDYDTGEVTVPREP